MQPYAVSSAFAAGALGQAGCSRESLSRSILRGRHTKRDGFVERITSSSSSSSYRSSGAPRASEATTSSTQYGKFGLAARWPAVAATTTTNGTPLAAVRFSSEAPPPPPGGSMPIGCFCLLRLSRASSPLHRRLLSFSMPHLADMRGAVSGRGAPSASRRVHTCTPTNVPTPAERRARA